MAVYCVICICALCICVFVYLYLLAIKAGASANVDSDWKSGDELINGNSWGSSKLAPYVFVSLCICVFVFAGCKYKCKCRLLRQEECGWAKLVVAPLASRQLPRQQATWSHLLGAVRPSYSHHTWTECHTGTIQVPYVDQAYLQHYLYLIGATIHVDGTMFSHTRYKTW